MPTQIMTDRGVQSKKQDPTQHEQMQIYRNDLHMLEQEPLMKTVLSLNSNLSFTKFCYNPLYKLVQSLYAFFHNVKMKEDRVDI